MELLRWEATVNELDHGAAEIVGCAAWDSSARACRGEISPNVAPWPEHQRFGAYLSDLALRMFLRVIQSGLIGAIASGRTGTSRAASFDFFGLSLDTWLNVQRWVRELDERSAMKATLAVT